MDTSMSPATCQGKLTAIGDALYVLGGKWKLRIIIALKDGHVRFNDLQRTINGISAKVLSGELKDLELNGFIVRKVNPGIPVVVEYELTAYSDTLHDVMQSLSAWGEMHREKIRSEGQSASIKKAAPIETASL